MNNPTIDAEVARIFASFPTINPANVSAEFRAVVNELAQLRVNTGKVSQ